jgi:hypothetical protein
MYSDNKIINIESKFTNYVSTIKEDLLNQIMTKESNCRIYFEMKYDELIYKYISTVNTLNYNIICCKFVRDVYNLVPILDAI